MKKALLALALTALAATAFAQKQNTAFKGYLYNNEYDVYLRIDFYNESVSVPGNELYGRLPGYLGKKNNSFCWAITAARVADDETTAELSLINDYGSEDLTATLTVKNDSIYELKQVEGSALKVPKDGKWQKLPKVLTLKRR